MLLMSYTFVKPAETHIYLYITASINTPINNYICDSKPVIK